MARVIHHLACPDGAVVGEVWGTGARDAGLMAREMNALLEHGEALQEAIEYLIPRISNTPHLKALRAFRDAAWGSEDQP